LPLTVLRSASPDKPMEFLYDRIGKMLNFPPRQVSASPKDRAPEGFHKLKVVAESVDLDGNVRSRRIAAAIPVAGGEAKTARVKWEKDGTSLTAVFCALDVTRLWIA